MLASAEPRSFDVRDLRGVWRPAEQRAGPWKQLTHRRTCRIDQLVLEHVARLVRGPLRKLIAAEFTEPDPPARIDIERSHVADGGTAAAVVAPVRDESAIGR